MGKQLKIKQIKSTIGRLTKQKLTMKALGIKKMGQTVVHEYSPSVSGMVDKVRHLVTVEEIDGE